MHRAPNLLLIAVFCAASATLPAQAPQTHNGGPAPMANTNDGGVSEVLQSIYIPPLLNAPFTATVHTEWTRPMANGGTYTFVNQRMVARDSRGRIYEQRWLLVPRGSEDQSRMNVIQIADPVAHTLYNCFTLKTPQRCVLDKFAEPALTSYTPPVLANGPLPNNNGTRIHEDLGSRAIEGIEVFGTRDTVNYNAGVMGSDQPFSIWREFWQEPHLGVNLYSEVVNPSVGKQVFTLSEVLLSEPDPRLFELPDGFAVVDNRKPPAPQESADPRQ